jgi:hypothetical protein
VLTVARAPGVEAAHAGSTPYIEFSLPPHESLPGWVVIEDSIDVAVRRIGVRVSSTSDPEGITVPATRYVSLMGYVSEVWFTTDPSKAGPDRLLVADGDDVHLAYHDTSGPSGAAATIVETQQWVGRSDPPGSLEVVYSTADLAGPVVRGGWRSVAPGATVRVYDPVTPAAALGSSVAGMDGSFSVALPSATPPLPTVEVAVEEPGYPQGERTAVDRAAITGRVLTPGAEPLPVLAARVSASGADYATAVSGLSGLFSVERLAAGDYTLDVDAWSWVMYGRAGPPEWWGFSYGDPPARTVTVADAEVTVDLGDVMMLPPNFVADVRDAAGDAVLNTNLLYNPGGARHSDGWTRPDGKAGLHLPDGDHIVRASPAPNCEGYGPVDMAVSVVGGIATPGDVALEMTAGSAAVAGPLRVPAGGDLVDVSFLARTGRLVDVVFDEPSGSGAIESACATSPGVGGVTAVGRGVTLLADGVKFEAADVCLGYTEGDLAEAGVAAGEVDLFHTDTGGWTTRITTSPVEAEAKVCGAPPDLARSHLFLGVGTPVNPEPTTTTTTTRSTTTTLVSAPDGGEPSPAEASGYRMVGSDGSVYAFGDASWLGGASVGEVSAVDIEGTPSGDGYWVVDSAGHVFAFGRAPWLGGASAVAEGESVVSLSATPTGRGYWLFTSSGRVLSFGDAGSFGDLGAVPLNGPVLDSVATPSGRGYYMVASDGGVFAFGDASFAGSMGGVALNAPVQSLVPDAHGSGYWLVASDGGIFAFSAPFYGSMGGVPLNRPVTGMVGASGGYLMVAEDGGIFAFGAVPFHGSLGASPPASPVVAVAAL